MGHKPQTQTPAPPAAPSVPPPAPRSNVTPSTQDTLTPQRQASMRLVEKGRAQLEAQDADRAAAVLMDAVNVDASNGVAYYYLAAANQQLGRNEIALGLLDKAEALLGADPEWMGRIDELRAAMGGAVTTPVGPSPIDQQF